MPSEELVHAVLSNTKLWGEDLTAVGDLEGVVEAQLFMVRDDGIRDVMLSLGENGF